MIACIRTMYGYEHFSHIWMPSRCVHGQNSLMKTCSSSRVQADIARKTLGWAVPSGLRSSVRHFREGPPARLSLKVLGALCLSNIEATT